MKNALILILGIASSALGPCCLSQSKKLVAQNAQPASLCNELSQKSQELEDQRNLNPRPYRCKAKGAITLETIHRAREIQAKTGSAGQS